MLQLSLFALPRSLYDNDEIDNKGEAVDAPEPRHIALSNGPHAHPHVVTKCTTAATTASVQICHCKKKSKE
jgi:hypothetical protein